MRRVHIVGPSDRVIEWAEVTVRLALDKFSTKVVIPIREYRDLREASETAMAQARTQWPGYSIKFESGVVRRRVVHAGGA